MPDVKEKLAAQGAAASPRYDREVRPVRAGRNQEVRGACPDLRRGERYQVTQKTCAREKASVVSVSQPSRELMGGQGRVPLRQIAGQDFGLPQGAARGGFA